MHLSELKKNGFVGSELQRRMSQSLPGALADVVDQILYILLEDGDYLRLQRRIFVNRGVDAFPKWNGLEDDGAYTDLQKTLREVFHYLEACAFREATKNW